MLELFSLQSFYLKQTDELCSPFELVVKQFFEQGSLEKEGIDECKWSEPLLNEEKTIDNWKNLLAVNILCDLAQQYQSEVAIKIRFFERHPWNQRSQYVRALVALNHALANMPIPDVGVNLLEGGAALIDLREYCPWLSLPYTPQHFEFAIFLCLLCLKTKREDLKEAVLRLAHWQLKTLDAHGKPLTALFVKEKDGKPFLNLCISYLFFRGAAILKEETPFAVLADLQIKFIQELIEQKKSEKIPPLWPIVERWLSQYKMISNAPLSLSETVYDSSTALVGYRSSSQYAFCTLHGGHTGLGTIRWENVEIVNYGPQYLPLGECQGFGIEGNALSDHGIRKSALESEPHRFFLKGCTRLVDQPIHHSFDAKKFRGIWLEVIQEFRSPFFDLKANFLTFEGWSSVAFSFFVKASCCRLTKQHCLFPRTLERYEGEGHTVSFENQQGSLVLHCVSFKGMMQVIPLGGGNNFWGADFLVAFLLNPEQQSYHWQVRPSSSS